MEYKVVEFKKDTKNPESRWEVTNTLATWRDAEPWAAVNYMEGYVAAMLKYKKGLRLDTPMVKQLDGYMYYNHATGYMIAAVDGDNNILDHID